MFGRSKRFEALPITPSVTPRYVIIGGGDQCNVYDSLADTLFFEQPVPEDLARARIAQLEQFPPTYGVFDHRDQAFVRFGSKKFCRGDARFKNRTPPDNPSFIERSAQRHAAGRAWPSKGSA